MSGEVVEQGRIGIRRKEKKIIKVIPRIHKLRILNNGFNMRQDLPLAFAIFSSS